MTLRERAERALDRQRPAGARRDVPEYELEVHQMELEMQNEELRGALSEVEAAHERYFQLFDLAPIAYVTLDRDGIITESNFAAATLLRVNRRELVGRRLSAFIDGSSADAYTLRLREVLAGSDMRQLEIDLATPPLPVRLTFNAIRKRAPAEDILGVRLAIIDLTEIRESRASLVRASVHLEALGARARHLAELLAGAGDHAGNALSRLEADSPARPHLEELRRTLADGAALVGLMLALDGYHADELSAPRAHPGSAIDTE